MFFLPLRCESRIRISLKQNLTSGATLKGVQNGPGVGSLNPHHLKSMGFPCKAGNLPLSHTTQNLSFAKFWTLFFLVFSALMDTVESLFNYFNWKREQCWYWLSLKYSMDLIESFPSNGCHQICNSIKRQCETMCYFLTDSKLWYN